MGDDTWDNLEFLDFPKPVDIRTSTNAMERMAIQIEEQFRKHDAYTRMILENMERHVYWG